MADETKLNDDEEEALIVERRNKRLSEIEERLRQFAKTYGLKPKDALALLSERFKEKTFVAIKK